MDKLRNTFIETLKNYVVKGRIHADINQLRGDQGGTLTGRLSYSHPNLQQLPNYNDFGTGILLTLKDIIELISELMNSFGDL